MPDRGRVSDEFDVVVDAEEPRWASSVGADWAGGGGGKLHVAYVAAVFGTFALWGWGFFARSPNGALLGRWS